MEGSWRDRPRLASNTTTSKSTGTSTSLPPPYGLRNEDAARAQKAIEEGRRIYLGSLPYEALTGDVEKLFDSNQYSIEHIDMSVDPFTGRNPSYCFIELLTPAQATAAIADLNGQLILGRPVKINLATTLSARHHHRNDYIHDRWHPHGERARFDDAADDGRRLYVGGLPRMPNQATVNREMRELFAEWEVDGVSKIISPHESRQGRGAGSHYVFVDFRDAAEAVEAAGKLDGVVRFGGRLTINAAKRKQGRKIAGQGRGELDQDWNARKFR